MANIEYSNYLEGLPTAPDPLSGDEIIGASKDGDAVGLTAQQIADLAPPGGGTVTSVSGTADRITSTGGATPVIDIAAAYDAIVASKAPLASPALTGTPTAPTASAGTNNTQLATTAYADRKSDWAATIKTETASHPLDADDLSDVNAGKIVYIHMNVAGANDLTIPPNSTQAFPVGAIVFAVQIGAGQTTIVAGAGVTIRNPDGLILAGQYAQAMVRKIATDEWIAGGELKI